MNEKKIIGISGGSGVEKSFIRGGVNEQYFNAVIEAGGVPMMIPINQNREVIKKQLTLIDGLILTGGVDIHPRYYNQEINKNCGDFDQARDAFEFILLEEAKKQSIPLFGICRGIQIINVFYGGSLFQDIIKHQDFFVKHSQSGSLGYPSHTIEISKDSFLFNVYQQDIAFVNSYHHQAIDTIANNFKVVAKSKDGIIEAIEHVERKIYAVQFHPEMTYEKDEKSLELFKYFINETNLRQNR